VIVRARRRIIYFPLSEDFTITLRGRRLRRARWSGLKCGAPADSAYGRLPRPVTVTWWAVGQCWTFPKRFSELSSPRVQARVYIWVLSARASRAARLLCLSDGMSSRGVAWRPLLCGTGNSADARVSSRRAPRSHDTFLRHRVAGLLACCRTQPRVLCASTSNAPRGPVEPDSFFNRAEELARLERLLSSTPTTVLLVTGPPSCGKSGACSAEWTVTLATPDSWTGLQRC